MNRMYLGWPASEAGWLALPLVMPGEAHRMRSEGPKELPRRKLTSADVALPKALGPGSDDPAG